MHVVGQKLWAQWKTCREEFGHQRQPGSLADKTVPYVCSLPQAPSWTFFSRAFKCHYYQFSCRSIAILSNPLWKTAVLLAIASLEGQVMPHRLLRRLCSLSAMAHTTHCYLVLLLVLLVHLLVLTAQNKKKIIISLCSGREYLCSMHCHAAAIPLL